MSSGRRQTKMECYRASAKQLTNPPGARPSRKLADNSETTEYILKRTRPNETQPPQIGDLLFGIVRPRCPGCYSQLLVADKPQVGITLQFFSSAPTVSA